MRINDDLLINPKVNGSVYADAFKSKNLFNKSDAILGYDLSGNTGEIQVKSNYYTSDFIEVEPNTEYYITKGATGGKSNCFYDSNKNYISTVNAYSGKITVPNNSNIKYMRMNGLLTDIDNVQIEKGLVGTSYMPFKSYGIESGSNDNGSYVKFEDGTMICYGEKAFEVNFSTFGENGMYRAQIYGAFVFPATFITYPSITAQTQSSGDYTFCWVYAVERTKTNIFRLDLIRPVSASSNNVTIDYIAIGRWK